jgi:hypothetical protein
LLLLLPVLLALEELLDRLLDRLLEDFRRALLEVPELGLSSNPFMLWDLLEGCSLSLCVALPTREPVIASPAVVLSFDSDISKCQRCAILWKQHHSHSKNNETFIF